jgi:hypothetical protein
VNMFLATEPIGAQPGGDLIQAMSASEDGDEGVVELLRGGVLDGLLRDADRLACRLEEVELSESQSDGR